jgi:hypothetical protein
MVNSVMTKHNNKQRISKYPYLGIAGENTKEPVIVLFDTLNSGTLIYDGGKMLIRQLERIELIGLNISLYFIMVGPN